MFCMLHIFSGGKLQIMKSFNTMKVINPQHRILISYFWSTYLVYHIQVEGKNISTKIKAATKNAYKHITSKLLHWKWCFWAIIILTLAFCKKK